MSVASLGAALTGGVCVAVSMLGHGELVTLVYALSILSYMCFTTTALVRREFYGEKQNPARWRRYVWAGAILGVGAITYTLMASPARILSIGFATSVAAITAGLIIRCYILPLGLGVRAAYLLGEQDLRKLMRRVTRGDTKAVLDVLGRTEISLDGEKGRKPAPKE